jgi:tetratricopeptide (TPR) repeat protein
MKAASGKMGTDDDIGASLPRPPLPAPARREAAIEEALRRFDGAPASSSAGEGRGLRRASGWWTLPLRPYAAALASIILVALIAVPVALMSPPGRQSPPGDAVEKTPESGPPAAPADSNLSASASAAADVAASDEAASPPPGEAKDGAAAARPVELAQPLPQPPSPAAPPPPPPPAAGWRADEARSASEARDAQPAEAAPAGSEAVTVTGSRIARPNLRAPAPSEPKSEYGAIAVTGARKSAAARGDWNACTVDDPGRSLRGCRQLVDREARGAAGRANARVADGLALAWKGDLNGAAAAFGQAIQIAPRSSFAYLNRGLARRRNGDLDGALADLDRAVLYAPRTARNYYNRSLVLRQRGDIRRARADEARAIELNEDYADLVR